MWPFTRGKAKVRPRPPDYPLGGVSFRELPIGTPFYWAIEYHPSPVVRNRFVPGPWEKVDARRYRHLPWGLPAYARWPHWEVYPIPEPHASAVKSVKGLPEL